MKRTKWVDRKFSFDIPEGWLVNTISRLEGTAIRLKSLTKALSDVELSQQIHNGWSIKEHVGHLADLEAIHLGRIYDFIDKKDILRAADMSNKRTNEANHNNSNISELITQFNTKRKVFIEALQNLDDDTQQFVSMHPRLKEKMKPVDLAFFTAEHDDHHVATISSMIKSFY